MGNGGGLKCDCGSSPLLWCDFVKCIAGVVEDDFGIGFGFWVVSDRSEMLCPSFNSLMSGPKGGSTSRVYRQTRTPSLPNMLSDKGNFSPGLGVSLLFQI